MERDNFFSIVILPPTAASCGAKDHRSSKTKCDMSALFEALCEFDGKAVSILSEAQAQFGASASFLPELVDLASRQTEHIADGATWLIKNCLEKGERLTPETTAILFSNLNEVTTWQAQLHVCQSFAYLEIPSPAATNTAAWLDGLLQHKRPFLRAWSMDAYQHLAIQHPSLEARAEVALAEAERDQSASVKARARHARKRRKPNDKT